MKCTRAQMKLLSPKSRVRLGTWNGSHHVWAKKMCLDSEGDEKIQPKYFWSISERRWNTFGLLRTASGETILYSGTPMKTILILMGEMGVTELVFEL